jgi:hypothetical protein
MASATRPYVVFEDGKAVALIRTTSASRAIAFHKRANFEAHLADADEMFALGKQGFEIVDDKAPE